MGGSGVVILVPLHRTLAEMHNYHGLQRLAEMNEDPDCDKLPGFGDMQLAVASTHLYTLHWLTTLETSIIQT